MSDVRGQALEDETRLGELLASLFEELDTANGSSAAQRLTDPAVVDQRVYDPQAGRPEPLAPSEIGAQWEAYLYAFDAIEHRLGAPRFTVHADAALGLAHLRVQLAVGGARLVVFADLVTRFQRIGSRWYLERLELDVLAEEGDPSVRL